MTVSGIDIELLIDCLGDLGNAYESAFLAFPLGLVPLGS
jgi:hypothetical protein